MHFFQPKQKTEIRESGNSEASDFGRRQIVAVSREKEKSHKYKLDSEDSGQGQSQIMTAIG